MNGCLCVNELLLNDRADFDDIFTCLSGSLDGSDTQLDPVGPTRRRAQTGILRFAMEILVYKRLLL